MTLRFDRPIGRVLALGAHADDIEIGAAGLLLTLCDAEPDLEVTFAIFTGDDSRRAEAEASHAALVGGAPFHWLGAADGHLPYDDPAAAKAFLRSAVEQTPPLVICPNRDDAHQDHRFVAELAWQVCRGATILEYHIPKWDPEATNPNVFVALEPTVASAKLDHLANHFPSQHAKGWYERQIFEAQLLDAGVKAGCRHAEPFTMRKAVLT